MMPAELPISECPKCRSSNHVRAKLIATNLLVESNYLDPLTVETRSQFLSSPYTLGEHFVSGLFCDECEVGFIPDSIASGLGAAPRRNRGSICQTARPFGVGQPRLDNGSDGFRRLDRVEWPGSGITRSKSDEEQTQ